MSLLHQFIDLFLHLDKHLADIVSEYGVLTYAILFAIIFAETGFVVTPFLPGDSLLFMSGAIAALDAPDGSGPTLNVFVLFFLLVFAAILGDTVNYYIGDKIGSRAFSGKIKWLKQDYLAKTQAYFDEYGGKTSIMARFVPIVRTFTPFVAGVGTMPYGKFISYCIAGALIWVSVCLSAGYFFGNLEVVKKNFSLVVLGIIFISILPAIIGLLRKSTKKQPAA